MADYIYLLASRLPVDQQKNIDIVVEAARAHGMQLYLTGGAVRDVICGANIRDVDFTVQGHAQRLRKDLEKVGAIIEHDDEELRTLQVLMPGGLRCEISAARTEIHEKPGRAPEISFTNIHEDLRRRDFSCNAMALSLNEGSRGLLIDPFNGVADIEAKHLRLVNNFGFLEEPSRLIRAIRFTARFDWQLEDRTKARYDSAVEGEYIKHATKRVLGHEAEQLAHEPDPVKVVKALDKEGWLRHLHSHWSIVKVDVPGLTHLLKLRQQMVTAGYTLDTGAAVMWFLTSKMNSTDVASLQAAIPRKAFVQQWKHLEDESKDFCKKLMGKENNLTSSAYKFLGKAKGETVLFTWATQKQAAVTRRINDFFGKWRDFRKKLPFLEMAELRITSNLPIYDKLMEDCFFLLLDGKLRTQPEIIKYLKPFSPPEPVAPPQAAKKSKAVKKPLPGDAKKALPAKTDSKAVAPKTDAQPAAHSAKVELKPAVVTTKPSKPMVPAKAVATLKPVKAAIAKTVKRNVKKSVKPMAKAKKASKPIKKAKAAKAVKPAKKKSKR